MNENYQLIGIKKSFIKIFSFSLIVACSSVSSMYAQKTPTGRLSVKSEKWQKGGLFEGYSPSQEILEKRSRTTKQFRNANGSVTSQIAGMIHYQDNSGAWQDIDYTIKNTNAAGYKFSNETNQYKSYFPEAAGTKAVKFKLNQQTALNWWKSPKLEFTSNGNVIKSFEMNSEKGISSQNKVRYNNVYPNISEEFEVLPGGLENNTIINSLSSEMNSLPADAKLNFSQVIELNAGWKIVANGKNQTQSFNSKSFQITTPGFEDGLTFSPIFIYDNKLTKEEALAIVFSPKEKLTAAQQSQLENHIFQCDYIAEFTNEGLKITTSVPVSWLKNSSRSFPVTIDPIVTIGTTPGTGDFRCPISHWYGFQRHADLYLQSEIGGYGLISSIEFYKTSTAASRTKPTKVFFRDTPATTLTGTDAWDSATYTGGLTASFDGTTTQDNVVGWKMITMTNSYSYTSGNLLVMIYDAYGGGGSAQNFTETNVAGTQRQAFNRVDTTNPGDGAATAVENYLPAIRITYSNPVPPTVASFAPTTGCSSTGTVVITGTNFDSVSAVTIGGTPVTSYIVNNTTQITAIIGTGTTGVISVTTPFGTAASTDAFTVNQSPVVAAIAGGAATVCANADTPAFTNATPGGTWGIVNGTGLAGINVNGVVSGASAGGVTVTYTVSDGTCSTTKSSPLNVVTGPTQVTMSGLVSPSCANVVQTLTSTGGSVNATFVTEAFDASTLPTGWSTNAGAGDTVAVTNTSLAGGSPYEVTITGNSQATNINDRLIYGPFNSGGLSSVDLQWNGFLNHYSSAYAYTAKIQTSTDGVTWHDSSWITSPVTASIGPGLQNATISTADVGSSTLYVAFVTSGFTFGFHRWSIDNVSISGLAPAAITWSPSTGLYTNAAATVPYTTGTSATTVYAKPLVDTTYTVTATNTGGCTTTNSGSIQVTPASALPTGASTQEFTAGQTIANLVVAGTNLIWYSSATGAATIPTSTPLVDGTVYYVTQTENGSCESDRLPITADNPLSNGSFDHNNFSYFPNPVKNTLNLSYNQEISNVEVFNLLGQKVISNKTNANSVQIDMSNLSMGAYMVKVTSDNHVKTIKVVKE